MMATNRHPKRQPGTPQDWLNEFLRRMDEPEESIQLPNRRHRAMRRPTNICAWEFSIMGRKTRNLEVVTDYADGTHFVRLHRDILLPASICEAVRRHLNAGRWQEAKNLMLEHAMANAHDEIELFFDSTADRLDQERRAEKDLTRNPELAEYSCG
jgi:hypothetical protein